jgi:uncharacterized protein YbbK (DUF523 family)
VSPRIRIAVSRCLLGDRVRYDGGHKRSDYLVETLAAIFEIVPVCPELEAGLGVPRPPVRLVIIEGQERVRGVDDPEVDVTEILDASLASARVRLRGISGLVLKSGSPSCGIADVPVFDVEGARLAPSQGRFAAAVRAAFPTLPMEDEIGLQNPDRRDAWLARVRALASNPMPTV